MHPIQLQQKMKTERLVILSLAGLVLLSVALGSLLTTIAMIDTDLWYHLSGGRHLFTHGSIQDKADFSFLEPTRIFTNYYWLFQAVIYLVHSQAGYFGLILVRTVFALSMTGALLMLLIPWERSSATVSEDAQRAWNRRACWGLIWCVVLCLALSGRFANIRPHIVSYASIAVFLLILEKYPRRLWLLPLLGVFWMNVHGITYPVLLTICGGYLADALWERYRAPHRNSMEETGTAADEQPPKYGRFRSLWLVATMFTVFITPHFTDLLAVPFSAAKMQEFYVQELKPFVFTQRMFLAFYPPERLATGMSGIIVLAAPLALLALLVARRARPSQILLLAAGFVLLSRHSRLYYEFALLTAPLVGAALDLGNERLRSGSTAFRLTAASVLVLLLALALVRPFSAHRNYPFSDTNLPTGSMDFLLKNAPPGSKVLNPPSYGGYVQWRLSPRHNMLGDMQMSLFDETDTFIATRIFKDKDILGRLLERYQPEFIFFPQMDEMPEVLEFFPELMPVFFDGASVLLVDSRRLPEFATLHDLGAFSPFGVHGFDAEGLRPEEAERQYQLLAKLLENSPREAMLHHVAGELAIRAENVEAARGHGRVLLQYHPQLHSGPFILGQAALVAQQWPEAMEHFAKAVELANTPEARTSSLRNLYIAALKAGEYERAYEALLRATPPFAEKTTYKDHFELAIGAAASGHHEEGRLFLHLALLQTPEDDAPFRERIRTTAKKLGYELEVDKSG